LAPEKPGPPARLGRFRPLFVLATVLMVASVSVLLPVAGTAAALTAILALRAADLTAGRLSRRRSARGQRSSDTVVSALTYPLMLAWSAVISLALSPVALVAGGIGAAITLLAVHTHPFPQAVAFGAGALVASYGLGPGSESPRRQLGKIYDAAARSPGAAAVTLVVVCALALALLGAAVSDPAFYWPLTGIGNRLQHLDVLHSTTQSARSELLRLLHRLV
jgi:hypothetical protein